MNCRPSLPGKARWAAALAALVLAAVSPLTTGTGPDDSPDRYRVLVERNIFLRDRRRARPGRSSLSPRPIARDSDRDIVLTGIGRRNGESVAFFENIATGITTRTGVDEAVGKGRIRSITLDVVQYERDGSVGPIEVGHALRGGRFIRETAVATSPATTRPSETGQSTSAPAGAPSEPTAETGPAPAGGGAESSDIADILRRMRQRREQELRR
jgi:hypothetical protein